MKKNFLINHKNYELTLNTSINSQLLSSTVNHFWTDVYTPLYQKNNQMHLVLMCKAHFVDNSEGYKSLGHARRVNFDDLNIFIEYLTERINILNDSYTVLPCQSLEFTYFIKDGLADENRLLKQDLKYQVATHGFNRMNLPLTMDPLEYGVLIGTMNLDTGTRYIVKNDITVFTIVTNTEGTINRVRIEGAADLTWVDTKLDNNTFKRELPKNTIYVRNGQIVVKEKELPAKAFSKGKMDKSLALNNTFMTMDIEAFMLDRKEFKPYLICAYNEENFIQSFVENPLNETDVSTMFNNFIGELCKVKSVKYVYAHNLSGFDGIFLIKHLLNYPDKIDVAPLITGGKLKSITLKFLDSKGKTRIIVFKDSYLLLPFALRKLCHTFEIDVIKSNFPFLLKDTNYNGEFPGIQYWPSKLKQTDYDELRQQFGR